MPISIKLGINHPCGKGPIVQIKGQVLFKGEMNLENAKMGWGHLKILSSRTNEPESFVFT